MHKFLSKFSTFQLKKRDHKSTKPTDSTTQTTPSIPDTMNTKAFLVQWSSLLLMAVGLMFVYALQGDFSQLHIERMSSSWGYTFGVIVAALFVFKAGMDVHVYHLFIF